jgi:hypothetical protein
MIDHKHPCIYCAGRYWYSCVAKEDRCKHAHANRKECLDLDNQKRLNDKHPQFNDGSVWKQK